MLSVNFGIVMKTCLYILLLLLNLNIISAQQIKIVDQSKSSVYCEGYNVEIWIDADGSNLVYNWYKDGIQIPNQITRFLMIKNLNSLNSGLYYCIVSSGNNSETVRSKDIAVYMATPTRFVKKPIDVNWDSGINAELLTQLHTNDISELKNIKINWFKEIFDVTQQKNIRTLLNDNKKYSGTKTEKLLIKKLVWSDRANYICIAVGLCGSDSVKAIIGDVSYFKIIKETGNFNECEGSDAVFRVRVEQSIPGTLEFQWYKVGYKKLVESSKYEGTNTRQLTIHNVKKEDENSFYVLVTLKEYGVSQRSERFDLTPKYTPVIWVQPRNYMINYRYNQYQFIDLYATVSNMDSCVYEWYRNDTLIVKDSGLYHSSLKLPSERKYAGQYWCRISNECGYVWSDSANVFWGMDDKQACVGETVSIIADNMNTEQDSSYYYIWKKNGVVIKDTQRFSGSNTYTLTIKEVNTLDSGFYDVWIVNFKKKEQKYFTQSFVIVAIPPYIVKNLPDTLRYEDSKWLPQKYITVFSDGPILYYQLFKDGKPYNDEAYININNIYSQYQPFLFGGYVNFPPGKYHYHFRNNCGEVDSKEFVIINEFQSGIVKSDSESDIQPGESYLGDTKKELNTSVFDEIPEINTLSISPNPANEYFQLTLNSSLDESSDIELYDSFGKLIHKESRYLQKGINKFIINNTNLNLSSGVYFIRLKSESKIIIGSVVIVK